MRGEPSSAFEPMYRGDPDPWSFRSSWYERRRYEATIALLPAERYRRAFEPGCSIGELTWRLAARADHVVAWEASSTAAARARERCAALPDIEVEAAVIPARWPTGNFDLVVLSELGYYFDRDELAALRDRAVASLEPGGTLIGVHWLGHSPDHVLHGDEVHEVLADGADIVRVAHLRDEAIAPGFRADVWARR